MRVSFFISKDNFTHIYQQIAHTDEKNAVSDNLHHHIIIDLEYAQSNFF